MANKYQIHFVNMALQAGKIRKLFPKSILSYNQNSLKWEGVLIPSPLSSEYEIMLRYIRGKNPDVYVIKPKLKFFPGKTRLPHVYDTDKQWLCLYYRGREWNNAMLIADYIIPWICEWLLHYECWLGTGEWKGGGIHLEMVTMKKDKMEKETSKQN